MYEYSGVSVKIKAMLGKRLSKKDYIILSEKKSVKDIIAYLKNHTDYAEVLADLKEPDMHRGRLEKILYDKLYNELSSLKLFVHGDIKNVLSIVSLRFEIHILKNLIRALVSGQLGNISSYVYLSDAVHEYTQLDIPNLITAKNIDDFVKYLEGTDYYSLLRSVAGSGKVDLSIVEDKLDMFYFESLHRLSKDFESIRSLVDMEIDLLNIVNAYRLITFHNVIPELIFTRIIPYGGKLSKRKIVGIVNSGTSYKCIENIKKTSYRNVFNFENNMPGNDMRRFLYKNGRRIINSGIQNFSVIYSYLFVLETEIRNVFSVVEGVRYNLAAEQIMKYIIV